MTQSGDTIYLVSDGGDLQRVPRHHYESEDFLQTLIEKYPEVLAGDQMGADESVRLILVKREAGVPDGDGASDRWSVDHLLLDQHGVPTLVEVKRSSDTRIRREVVGQLLEYAANIDVYWPSDRIRSLAVEQHGGTDELDRAILELLNLDPESDVTENVESYWSQVEENLRNGRLRLLFVADELPREVRRIIEFLNGKMNDVEVLGIELRQYVGDKLRAMVPRVIGQSEATRRTKGAKNTPSKHTTQDEMIAACPAAIQPYIVGMIEESERRGMTVYWGLKGFSVRARTPDDKLHSIFYCFPPGANGSPTAYVEGYMPPVLRGTDIGKELADSLLAIPGFKKGGQYTFRLDLTADTLDSVRQGLDVVWKSGGAMTQQATDNEESEAQPRPPAYK